MSEQVEVTKVVVRIGKKDNEMTIEQARELLTALKDLLGEAKTEKVYIPQPYPVTVPYPVPQPYYPRPYRYWEPWYISDGTSPNVPTTGTITYCLSGN